jgi:hypothetical protein
VINVTDRPDVHVRLAAIEFLFAHLFSFRFESQLQLASFSRMPPKGGT